MRKLQIDCFFGGEIYLHSNKFPRQIDVEVGIYIILRIYIYTFGRGNGIINPRLTPTFRGALSNLSCLLIAVERTNKFLVNAHECMFIFNRACS